MLVIKLNPHYVYVGRGQSDVAAHFVCKVGGNVRFGRGKSFVFVRKTIWHTHKATSVKLIGQSSNLTVYIVKFVVSIIIQN